MFRDMTDYGFEEFDFLIQGGFGDHHGFIEVELFGPRTSCLLPSFFSSSSGLWVLLVLAFVTSASR